MVQRDCWRILDDKEASKYKFSFCRVCPFYECELVEEYTQFRESHIQINKSQVPTVKSITADSLNHTGNSGVVIQATAVRVKRSEQDNGLCPTNMYADILSYDQSKVKDGCTMRCRHVYQIECGRKNVTDGIGDHFKIEITEKLREDCLSREKIIKKATEDRWEPSQPVFISAQTGQGKNYFIENTLIPYVKELNYKEKTSYKILILSNRLALKQQIKHRIDGNNDLEDEESSEEGQIYSYKEVADVMTYQSLLRHKENLKRKQNKAQSRYIFVICDEAHFFTSDAMFNPHTQKILETIIRLFQDAVRVYMSATPYECLEYIIKYEEQYRSMLDSNKPQDKCECGIMVFYHFKRDYSYFDVKTYSHIEELYTEIVESVNERKEKWLIFIDDKEKCAKVKKELEKIADDKKCPLVAEDDEKKGEKVLAIDAGSKKNPAYQEIVMNEKLNKDTYVLISTSVLDNGVNLTGIKNIVVSDMEKSKCLQMVGRSRKNNDDERKTLYMKRFCADEADRQIKNLMRQQDAYHSYELAYPEEDNVCRMGVYKFFNKYYCGKEADWKDAKHWFGISFGETKWYLNEIAKSLVEKLVPQYQYILDEMEKEKNECKSLEGQKYLEHQLSWFGKTYCIDNDVTFADKEKSKKEFMDFLKSYAVGANQIGKSNQKEFREKFTELCDKVYGRKDRNKDRKYSITKINSILEEENINYKVTSKSSYWEVEEFDWENEESE